ncbi:MAG: hypothetical protein JOZ39_08695 [Chloroflexi bacterium]|nr:hypothetical protein [Chloroflexota bacterium]
MSVGPVSGATGSPPPAEQALSSGSTAPKPPLPPTATAYVNAVLVQQLFPPPANVSPAPSPSIDQVTALARASAQEDSTLIESIGGANQLPAPIVNGVFVFEPSISLVQ